MEGKRNIVADDPIEVLKEYEGFNKGWYPDGGGRSIGYGFFEDALEPDEKALIADPDNITEEEAGKVLKVKVDKLDKMWNKEVKGFDTFAPPVKSALISMAYQLGSDDITDGKWPSMMDALKKAATYDEGTPERQDWLDWAATHMVYNIGKDGTRTHTTWAGKQTRNRALDMAAAVGEANKKRT